MEKFKKSIIVSVMIATVFSMSMLAVPASVGATAAAGDLIKMDGLSSVYYLGADNKRYVFPNEATYFSWYNDFSGVVTIPQSELESYGLKSNVTIRPGTKLVKITTDPKVYAIESGGELRWIDSEATASTLYGAEWAKRVVDVPDSFISNYKVNSKDYGDRTDADVEATKVISTAYPEGSLIKTADASAVYYIDATGNARQITTEVAFTSNRFSWDDVITTTLTIPTAGTNLAAAEATLIDTSSGAGGVPVDPIAGTGLTVALASDTPASTNLIVDATGNNAQGYAPVLKLNFTASSDGDVKIKTIKVKRAGLPSADTDLSNFQIHDGSATVYDFASKIADYSSVSDGVISFNKSAGLFTVGAGTTKTVMMTVDIADTAAASRNINFSVLTADDITSDGAAVSGSFPMAGNAMATVDVGTNLIGTLAVATQTDGSGNEPGQTAQELWKFRLTGANKKIDIHKIKFTMVGTIDADDLGNLKLMQSSTQLGETIAQLDSDKTITFDFSDSPFEINKVAKDFSLKGDIVGGTSRNYLFSIQSMDDIVAYDKENGVRIKPGSADAWTVVEAGATTISTGSLTVSRTLNTATGNIAADALDQVLASFDFTAYGEPIKVTSIYIEADTSSTTPNYGIDNGKVYVDGAQIGSTADLAEDTPGTFSMGNSLIIQTGETKQVDIRGDVKSTAAESYAADTTVVINLASTAGGLGNAAAYQKTISLGTANASAVAGYTRTIKSGALTTAKNASIGNFATTTPVGVRGATNVLMGSFVATVGAGEDVYITDVQVTDAGGAFSEVQNLRVKVDGTEVGTVTANPTTTTTYTYSVTPQYQATNSSNVLIEVYADIKSAATLTGIDAMVLAAVTATGVDTGATASDTNNRTGQLLVSATGGSLTVTLSGDTPASEMLVMGSTAIPVAAYQFEETTGAEDMVITQFKAINTLTTDTNLVSFSLWNGTTQIGTTQITSSSGVVTFSNLSFTVPAGLTKELTVKAAANKYPNASAGAENIIRVASGATYVIAEGAASGPQTVTVSTNLDGNKFEVYRTKLTATKGTVSGDGSGTRTRSSDQIVGQVKFVADSSFNAKLRGSVQANDEVTNRWEEVESAAGSMTVAQEGTNYIDGSYAIKCTIATTSYASNGEGEGFAVDVGTDVDASVYSKVSFWIRSSTTTIATDYKWFISASTSTTATSSAVQTGNVGVLLADVWTYVTADITGTTGTNDTFGIMFYGAGWASNASAAANVIVDNIRFYNDSLNVDITGDLKIGEATTTKFSLKDSSGTTKMAGYYFPTSNSNTIGTVTLIVNDDAGNASSTAGTDISVGSTQQTYTLYTSTSDMMKTDTTASETLTVSIDLGNASTAGDFRWYDGSVTATSPITWVSGSTPISFSYAY